MKFQPPKGTRDFLPEETITRQKVIEVIKTVFENYGFQPLETPAIESWEVLSAKGAGGNEILKETYNFEDLGKRRIGLRYDLTVPLARVVASNPSLQLPFKRYQIEKVWRYGDVTKGRFREFLQADVDIIGSDGVVADAEIIACVISTFTSLGFEKFLVRINNRKILTALGKYAKISSKINAVFTAIDKLDKVGIKGVERELTELKLPKDSIKIILDFIQIQGEPLKTLNKAEKLIGNITEGKQGISELKELINYLEKMKVEPKFKVDFSLARGLDYYTGPIFEVLAEEGIGSIAGGGRYDKMIGLFSGKDIPATGISLGIERIIEVMKERKMIKQTKNKTKVFVAAVNDEVRDETLGLVQKLRQNGISADFDLKSRNLTRQLKYADSIGIPFVIIVGKNELNKNAVKVKDMIKSKESEVKLSNLINFLTES